MNSKLNQPWLPVERIQALIQIEPAMVIVGLATGAWILYRLFLKKVSPERHRNLRKLFGNLAIYQGLWVALFAAYSALDRYPSELSLVSSRLTSYVGFAVLLLGATVLVKILRILLFEYLFFSHMKVGVPLLLVNLFTLLISILLGGLLISEVFGIQLAPLLATSAVFSLIVGLAVQDTLGNLFSGVALQFDKPYEIGDWIEGQTGVQKWVGQVYEISWRATVIIGLYDELITIPNRIMGSAQVANFSPKGKPISRSQIFRIYPDTDLRVVREALLKAAGRVPRIRKDPAPYVAIHETTESWIPVKLIYFIDDFGSQWLISDQVIEAALEDLRAAGIDLASSRMQVAYAAPR